MEKTGTPTSLVWGRNAVRELLSSGRDVDKIYIQKAEREGSVKALIARARDMRIPVIEVERSRLDTMCEGASHQGICAAVAEQNYSTVEEIIEYADSLGKDPIIVICDGIEDPHNLGAIIRSAECCGAHGIIIPKRRSVGLTSTVAKSSAGALEYMRVARVTNISVVIEELKELGFWIYAADMGETRYCDVDYSGKVALVLGSEGFGISRLVKEKCDFTVSIPLYGKINSMNVSCASAVILAEIARQKNK